VGHARLGRTPSVSASEWLTLASARRSVSAASCGARRVDVVHCERERDASRDDRIPCQSGGAGPPRIDPWMTGAGRVAAPQSVGLGRRAPARSAHPRRVPLIANQASVARLSVRPRWARSAGRTSARRARVDCGRRRSRSWSSGGPGPRSGCPYPARHQLDAVAVVLIPPRALASPAARAPRRPGSAAWRHLIERLIPIPVIGAVLLAGSATAA
jgi:hypothetical protein